MRDKLDDLLRVLEVEDPESAIIFCNTKDETKRVAAALDRRGYNTEWLNADLAQAEREKVMESTRRSHLRFLVCTDVAARGIDISHLTHVINFDFPESPEGYVHRTGRTGRAGRTGTAISLITPGDIGNLYILRLTYKIVPERQLPTRAELRTREELDLVEMFVQAFGSRTPHEDDVMLARRLLSHESVEGVVAGLLRDHLGSRPDVTAVATDNRRSRTPKHTDPGEVVPKAPILTEELPRQSPSASGAGGTESPATSSPARPSEHSPVQGKRRRRHDAWDQGATFGVGSEFESDFPIRFSVSDVADGTEPAAPAEGSPSGVHSGPKSAGGSGRSGASKSAASTEDELEIFLNMGRRDGVNSDDVLSLLSQSDVPRSDILHVNVRHHHTFVGVKRLSFRTVLGLLDGARIAGRVARAEQARSTRE
jgi:superfamily II DNA/RNA helicase